MFTPRQKLKGYAVHLLDELEHISKQILVVDCIRRVSDKNTLSGAFNAFVYSCWYVCLICKCKFIIRRFNKVLIKESSEYNGRHNEND